MPVHPLQQPALGFAGRKNIWLSASENPVSQEVLPHRRHNLDILPCLLVCLHITVPTSCLPMAWSIHVVDATCCDSILEEVCLVLSVPTAVLSLTVWMQALISKHITHTYIQILSCSITLRAEVVGIGASLSDFDAWCCFHASAMEHIGRQRSLRFFLISSFELLKWSDWSLRLISTVIDCLIARQSAKPNLPAGVTSHSCWNCKILWQIPKLFVA